MSLEGKGRWNEGALERHTGLYVVRYPGKTLGKEHSNTTKCTDNDCSYQRSWLSLLSEYCRKILIKTTYQLLLLWGGICNERPAKCTFKSSVSVYKNLGMFPELAFLLVCSPSGLFSSVPPCCLSVSLITSRLALSGILQAAWFGWNINACSLVGETSSPVATPPLSWRPPRTTRQLFMSFILVI